MQNLYVRISDQASAYVRALAKETHLSQAKIVDSLLLHACKERLTVEAAPAVLVKEEEH